MIVLCVEGLHERFVLLFMIGEMTNFVEVLASSTLLSYRFFGRRQAGAELWKARPMSFAKRIGTYELSGVYHVHV